MNSHEDKPLMVFSDVAKQLGVNVREVGELVKCKKLEKFVTYFKTPFITRESFNDYLKEKV